jgi:hypothetical protein
MRTRERRRMTQLATVALGLGLAADVAWGEQLGTVKSDDGRKKTHGRRVKVVDGERDGKRWIRSVEAAS